MVLGMKRLGKSVFARRLAKQYPRTICYDTLWEHDQFGYVIKDHLSLWRTTKPYVVYQGDTADFPKVSHFMLTQFNICFFIDEIERFANKHYIDSNLERIVNHGGHA